MAADPRKFLFNSNYQIDKISGSREGSVYVPAGGFVSPVVAHGLGYAPLYYTKWSTDPNFETSYDEIGVTTNTRLSFSVQADETNLYLMPANYSLSGITFYYRVIFFVPPNLDIDVPSTAGDMDIFQFYTGYNYTKVLDEGYIGSSSGTIDHDLGYYPQVELWYVRASDGRIVHLVENGIGSGNGNPQASVSTSSVSLYNGAFIGASGWYYKVYVDEN